MTNDTDVIVLGVGTCGEDLSLRLLGAGIDVVGIEAELVGGECAYWACLPSKMMIRAAGTLQEARRVDSLAGHATVDPDWAPVAARVRTEATGGWDDSTAVERFRSRGGQLVHGRGALVDRRTVVVGGQTFTARRGIVLATGSRPSIPPIAGLADVGAWTTRDVIALESLPESLLVLGGGAIGCELGQVLARFGVAVRIVEAAEHLLPNEEPEASAALEAALTDEGIAVHTGTRVERVESRDGGIVAHTQTGTDLAAERMLVATGRTVDLRGLGLDHVGIDESAPRIPVDDRMRAGEGIWAMGDVTGVSMFTHVALYQAAIIAADLLGEERPPARYDAVPRATFTDPEVGSVGTTEAEARAAGVDVEVVVKNVGSTFRGWLHATSGGVLKLVADRSTGTLIGATAVGPHAGEVLGMLTLAVHARVPVAELRNMIYAFPTFIGGVGEAVEAYDRGLATVLDPSYEGFRTIT